MIFDYELMFTDEQTAFTSMTNGVIGRIIDLAGKGQGKGFKSWIAFAFTKAVTGGPLSFKLETADNNGFSNSKEIPLSLAPLNASDMYAGAVYSVPLPVEGLERYCRLKISATSAVTLTGMNCGFVLDAPQY